MMINPCMDHSWPLHTNKHRLTASNFLDRLFKRPDLGARAGKNPNIQLLLYHTHQFRSKGLNFISDALVFENLSETCQIPYRCLIASTNHSLSLVFRMENKR